MKKLLLIIIFSFSLFVFPQFVYAEDVYDVILFWGQSNMVGYVGSYTCSNNELERNHVDENLTSLGATDFAKQSGILPEIVSKYKTMGHVDVPIADNTVYDYSFLTNSLVELDKDNNRVGEEIYVSVVNGNPVFNNDSSKTSSLAKSRGTNMAAWYAKTHYEKTGHKVIIVMGTHGGKKLSTFLPHKDDAEADSTTYTNDDCYLYEGMVTVYRAALNYMSEHNLTVDKKIDIVYQGGADAVPAQEAGSTKWDVIYKNIHNKLKQEFDMDFSVIIENAITNGSTRKAGLDIVNAAQKRAINNNDDVILGTDYPYKRFVPAEENYSGSFLGKTTSYAEAFRMANLSTGYQCDNTIHLNSAALSQVGYETALKVYDHIVEITPAPVSLTLNTLKVNGVSITDHSQGSYNISVESEIDKFKIECTLEDERASFVRGYGPREVDLDYGENKIYLKVTDGENTETYEFVVYRKPVETPDKSTDNPTVVPIPNTASFANKGIYIVGVLLLLSGCGICLYHFIHEENRKNC